VVHDTSLVAASVATSPVAASVATVSTRMLIALSLLCGLAILAAFAFQVLIR